MMPAVSVLAWIENRTRPLPSPAVVLPRVSYWLVPGELMVPSFDVIERPDPVDHVPPPEAAPQPVWFARVKVSSASVDAAVRVLVAGEGVAVPSMRRGVAEAAELAPGVSAAARLRDPATSNAARVLMARPTGRPLIGALPLSQSFPVHTWVRLPRPRRPRESAQSTPGSGPGPSLCRWSRARRCPFPSQSPAARSLRPWAASGPPGSPPAPLGTTPMLCGPARRAVPPAGIEPASTG